MAEILKQLGAQTGGREVMRNGVKTEIGDEASQDGDVEITGGRRRRHSKSRKGNSWLAHVKATMKDKKNKGKSFKQVLKLAKKTYKKSQSLSGGKRRRKTLGMYGGSGHATGSTFGSTAGSYPA